TDNRQRLRIPAAANHARVRILYLNPLGVLGGAERSLLDLMTALKAAHPEWSLQLITGSDGPMLAQARASGLKASVLSIPPSIGAAGDAAAGGPAGDRVSVVRLLAQVSASLRGISSYTSQLANLIVESRPHLVHANGFKMHIFAARGCPPGLPLVWHVHDYPSARALMPWLLRAHARRCSAVVANSESVAADVRAVLAKRTRSIAV